MCVVSPFPPPPCVTPHPCPPPRISVAVRAPGIERFASTAPPSSAAPRGSISPATAPSPSRPPPPNGAGTRTTWTIASLVQRSSPRGSRPRPGVRCCRGTLGTGCSRAHAPTSTRPAGQRLLTCPPQPVTSRCDATLPPDLGGRVPEDPGPEAVARAPPRGPGVGLPPSAAAASAPRGLPPPGYPAHEQQRPPSWLPALDEFVVALASRGAGPARIRAAHIVRSYDSADAEGDASLSLRGARRWRWRTRRLLYDIVGNRYCARVGRQHRSNHVFWEVDFLECTARQGCLDPDCGSFRCVACLASPPAQAGPLQAAAYGQRLR